MRMASYSPVTLEEAGAVKTTDAEELPSVIAEVRNAQSVWYGMPKRDRIAALERLLSITEKNAERIARTAHLETGKPRADAFSTEAFTSMMMIRECVRMAKDFKPLRKVDQGSAKLLTAVLGRRSYIEYRPLGVVAVISPYNFPFAIPFTETVTAVAAGNGVIIKPSSETPLCGHLIETVFRDSGFPDGLVKTVSGPGLGSALTDQDIDKIIFTGSPETGTEVSRAAAARHIPVTLELGGKDAMIVFDDADLGRTVAGAVWGSFVNSGQVCAGIKRIYVQHNVFDMFVRSFTERTKELKQGDGWNDPDVSVGPMINRSELDKMDRICTSAVSLGGTIVTGGKRTPGLKGYFFEPTIITGLPHSSDIVKNEIFGPIVTVFPFRGEEDAVRLAADSEFALGGSVWTSDIRKGKRIASMIDSGTVNVNNVSYTFGLPSTPWGGRKKSGSGITHGSIGFTDMMFPHHIHVDKARFGRDLWWMPYDREKSELQERMISLFGRGKGKFGTFLRILRVLRGKQ